MKTVLLIGGTRFVGRAILEKLLAENMRVVVYHRGMHPLGLSGPNLFEELGDCRSPLNYHSLFRKYQFDLIIHTVGYKKEDLTSLFPDIKKYKTPIIFISTGQVYIVTINSKTPFMEDDFDYPLLPAPQQDSDYRQWIYGVEKRDVEQLLDQWYSEYRIPSVSLRCPVIHGENDYSYRLYSYISRIMDAHPFILPYHGNSSISHLSINDLANAVFSVAGEEISDRQSYNLSMDEVLPLTGFIQNIAKVFQKKIRIFALNKNEYMDSQRMLLDSSPYSGKWVSVLDNQKFKNKYHWKPTPLNDWLPEIVRFQYRNYSVKKLGNYRNRSEEKSLLINRKEWLKEI